MKNNLRSYFWVTKLNLWWCFEHIIGCVFHFPSAALEHPEWFKMIRGLVFNEKS